MEKEPVKIVYNTLKEQIEEGWKMDELKAHYGLNHSQMKRVLQQTNLQIRKFRKAPAFIIEGWVEPKEEQKTEVVETMQVEDKEEICTEGENTLQVELTNLANQVEPVKVSAKDFVNIAEQDSENKKESPQKNFWE